MNFWVSPSQAARSYWAAIAQSLKKTKHLFLFYVYEYLRASLCVMCMLCAQRSQKRTSGPLELNYGTHVDAGNWGPQVSGRAAGALNQRATLPALPRHLFFSSQGLM